MVDVLVIVDVVGVSGAWSAITWVACDARAANKASCPPEKSEPSVAGAAGAGAGAGAGSGSGAGVVVEVSAVVTVAAKVEERD